MILDPKKNRIEETPEHSWPLVRPAGRRAGQPLSLWQRLSGWFRGRSATESWTPLAIPENSMPTLEPLSSTFAQTDDFDFLDYSDEDIAKLVANNHGTLVLYSSLDVIFDNRPPDVPFYTARKGRAFIALLFSERSLSSALTLERVAYGEHPMALDLKAIVDGRSPILRASFIFPDKLRSPLVFETLLNLCDEDVLEFLQAAADSDELDLLLRHESAPEATIDLSVSAPRLRGLVHSQAAALGRNWQRDLLAPELAASRQGAGSAYRSSQYGIEHAGGVRLRRAGRARCLLR